MINRLLQIDLTNQSFHELNITEEEWRKYLGGSGIATQYLYQHLDSSIPPLHPDNSSPFLPGLLTGIPIPKASKTSICGRYLLTGIWNEATVGSHWGSTLKPNEIECIIIKGRASHPVYLLINSEGIAFLNARKLWGLGTYKTLGKIHEYHPRFKWLLSDRQVKILFPFRQLLLMCLTHV